MDKAKFKKYVRQLISENPFIATTDEVAILGKVISAALRTPQVVLEPFFAKTFNFTEADFKDPKAEEEQLRISLRTKLISEGTFKVKYDLLEKATSNALISMRLATGIFKPASACDAVDQLPSNTSSGFPSFKRPKSLLKPEIKYQMTEIINSGSFKLISSNNVIYESWRTQERESGTKFRIFLIFPMLTNAFEMMFMKPILDYYSTEGHISTEKQAYSFKSDFNEMKGIWNYSQQFDYTLGLDYTQFDASISKNMLIYALRTIKSLFSMTWWEAAIFDQLVIIHSSAIIVSSQGKVPLYYFKKSGMLSGSVFTNFLATLINAIMVEYCILKQGIKSDRVFKKFKGDDTIIGTNEKLDYKQLIRDLTYHFGVVIKPEACQRFQRGDFMFYLGYYFTNDCKYASSTSLLYRKMTISGRFIPEDVIPNNLRVLSKAISILSNVTNGYDIFFLNIWPKFQEIYSMDKLPDYYFDLTEREKGISFITQKPILFELKDGWKYK